MVIDTSAIAAILFHEEDSERYVEALAADPVRLMSAINVLEAALVIEARKGEPGGREIDLLMHKSQIDVVAFSAEHIEEARAA